MNENVNGFLIVRKPETLDTIEPYNKMAEVDNKVYHGFERGFLYDLWDDYFKKELPIELDLIISNSQNDTYDELSFQRIRKLEDAEMIFNFIKKRNDFNEIIAIESDIVSKIKGAYGIKSSAIEWLGYDLIVFGGGSLILSGIFFKPEYFKNWIEIMNDKGLFTEKEIAIEYADDYFKLAKEGVVEDHIPSLHGFDAIRVGRVII